MNKLSNRTQTMPAPRQQPAQAPVRDEGQNQLAGDLALSPSVTAATVIDKFHLAHGAPGGVDMVDLSARIDRAAQAIRSGDLAEVEELLLAQAHALNAVFTQYAVRSASAATQDRASELLLLAMKAQSGSRATLATLVDLKFPRTTVIARQANVAQGHQQVNQVNNAAPTATPAPPMHTLEALPAGDGPAVPHIPRARTRKSAERTIRGRK